MKLNIKLLDQSLSENYKIKANHEGDSGIDLYVPKTVVIPPTKTQDKAVFIKLGVACEVANGNTGYYLFARSSISKTPLILANSVGIIDNSYRGEIMAAVHNLSDKEYVIEAGTRLFQLCAPTLEPISYTIVDELTETKRGTGGFGSTGK